MAFNQRMGRFVGWGASDELALVFKNGWTKEKILALPKGSRPPPKDYLDAKYISDHLSKFKNGVTKFSPTYPSGNIGPTSGTFVISKIVADDLILQSRSDVKKLEKLLGLDEGYLGKAPYRIDIDSPNGLRVPDGNELGANKYWLPGGKTSGGILEATVDQIKSGQYNANLIFN